MIYVLSLFLSVFFWEGDGEERVWFLSPSILILMLHGLIVHSLLLLSNIPLHKQQFVYSFILNEYLSCFPHHLIG